MSDLADNFDGKLHAHILDIAISGLSYQLGTRHRVEELPEFASHSRQIASLLRGHGPMHYCESEGPLWELAASCGRRTLESSTIPLGAVGAVVFASDSLSDQRGLKALLAELGIPNAYPINVSLSDCANLQIAIRIAGALICSRDFSAVLVISVDVARVVSPSSRVIGGGFAVLSDGAASILMHAGPGPFLIEATEQYAQLTPESGDGNVGSQVLARATAHSKLLSRLLDRCGIAPAEVRRVFPNHFSLDVLSPFFRAGGFRTSQLHLNAMASCGHCFSSDCLIGLSDFQHQTHISAGDRFILVGSGQSRLGAVLIRAAESMDQRT